MVAGLLALVGASVAWAGGVVARRGFAPEELRLARVGDYVRVELRGAELAEDPPGTPWLPSTHLQLVIPPSARATAVHATADEVLVARDLLVCPAQPPLPTGELPAGFVPPLAAAYAAEDRTPTEPAVLVGSHRHRGHRLVTVRLHPVRYVPARRELYLATELRVAVSYEEGAPAEPSRRSTAVASLVANPGDVARFSQPALPQALAD